MSLLVPWALLWLGAVPVLIWLWRLSATRRQMRIPSLIPFEHLLRRSSRQRRRLIVNALFWLQLAALAGLALALAQPVLFQSRARTVLVILDTSASMGAHRHGPSAFEQAKRILLARIARTSLGQQFFVLTTSPVAPVLPQATSDATLLTRAVGALRVSHLGGNLTTAAHIGRSLLGTTPDETVVVTDEPAPLGRLADTVRWLRVGEPIPNVAIVGLEAQGSLCTPADARLIATIQNFSNETAAVTVTATHGGRPLVQARADLAPRARLALPLALPEGAEGDVEVALEVPGDGLDVDNRAWMDVHRTATLPIVIRSQRPSFLHTVSSWLDACPGLRWTSEAPSTSGPFLLITDEAKPPSPPPAALLAFRSSAPSQPILSHWLVSSDHPISAYLAPVGLVAARVNVSSGLGTPGTPVVSALINGQKVPLVVVDEHEGRRSVSMLLDPMGADAPAMLLAFFNSLRWLMGTADGITVGEPLTAAGFGPGTVKVRRPDGSTETVETEHGLVQYEATTLAGLYRCSQGSIEMTVPVNFFNPLESNLLDRVSTWRVIPEPAAPSRAPVRVRHPLAPFVMMLLLVLLLIEWRMYSVKRL